MVSWGPTQYHVRHLIIRSCKVLEARDRLLKYLYRFENLAGVSAAVLSRHLPNFRAIGKLQPPVLRLRDFARSNNKTYAMIEFNLALCNDYLNGSVEKTHNSTTDASYISFALSFQDMIIWFCHHVSFVCRLCVPPLRLAWVLISLTCGLWSTTRYQNPSKVTTRSRAVLAVTDASLPAFFTTVTRTWHAYDAWWKVSHNFHNTLIKEGMSPWWPPW